MCGWKMVLSKKTSWPSSSVLRCCKMRRAWPVVMLAVVVVVSGEFFLGGWSLLARTKADVNVELQVGYSDVSSLDSLARRHAPNDLHKPRDPNDPHDAHKPRDPHDAAAARQNGPRGSSTQAATPRQSVGTGDLPDRKGERIGTTSKKVDRPLSPAVSSRRERNSTIASSDNKWIVVDFSRFDCPSQLTSFPLGWNVLVVGRATPLTGCVQPFCTVFNPDPPVSKKQVRSVDKAVWQLNRAYLWAISQGAKQLLDTDCFSTSPDALHVLNVAPTGATGLLYNATRHFNPYEHFGASAAVSQARRVSKDFPTTWNSHQYVLRDFDKVLVKHGLSDGSNDLVPRVGASRRQDTRPEMKFDPSAPPVFLGHESFSTVASPFTMYHQAALWGLLYPCKAMSVRCRVLRQLISQRMLTELDAFVGFYQVNATFKKRSAPVSDRQAAMLGTPLHKLQEDVHQWACHPQSSFSDCIAALAKALCVQDHMDCGDLQLVISWLNDLKVAGLPEPARASRPWRGVRKVGEVTVSLGSLKSVLESGRTGATRSLQGELVKPLEAACKGSDGARLMPAVATWTRPMYEDIVLVVVFNYNKFLLENLPYLEATHRPYFKHIVYCIPNVTEMTQQPLLRHVILMEGLSVSWYLMYECLTNAARMNIQGVRGYLQIGDDTLLNTWKLRDLPLDSLWLPQGTSTERAANVAHHWGWYWWSKSHGRAGVVHALADLEALAGLTQDGGTVNCSSSAPPRAGTPSPTPTAWSLSKKSQPTFTDLVHKANFSSKPRELPGSADWARPTRGQAGRFLCNYYVTNRLGGKVVHRAIDLFYVPQALKDYFVTLAHHFMRHQVLIELAVPVIAGGLDVKGGQVLHVGVSSLWSAARDRPQNFYSSKNLFLHPFKMHSKLAEPDGKDFFCNAYLVDLFPNAWWERTPS